MTKKAKEKEQVENKRRHKERLKKRGEEPNLDRAAPKRLERPTILVVCEGENTEKSYFRQFRLTTAKLVALGDGRNTVSLVNQAIELKQKGDYDQVWCVFDKDSFPDKNFNDAIAIANKNGFKVAYSNQAFEYWILLHFEDHQGGGMDRKEYNKAINDYLKKYEISYDGNKSKDVNTDLFDLMESKDETKIIRRTQAIRRAKRNYRQFDHKSPAIEESTTTVYLLVEEILKYV